MTDRITEFRFYIEKHLDSEKDAAERLERDEFLKEYPLSRLQELSVDEYCLGTDQSKDSFCYRMEFGKYKHTGFGIGGGSAQKFGIYFTGQSNVINVEMSRLII